MVLDCGIYKIENILNGDCYIGSSHKIKLRKKRHFYDLEKNIHGNRHLQRAYNKYGKDNFLFRIIIYCDESSLLFYEQSIINKCNPAYNICKICVSSPIGVKRSQETIQKYLSKRIYYSGESNPNYGRKHSQETIKKIRQNHPNQSGMKSPMFGRIFSDEHKRKISESEKGKIVSLETRIKQSKRKMIPPHVVREVVCLLENGASIVEIRKIVEISHSTIYKIKGGYYNDIYKI